MEIMGQEEGSALVVLLFLQLLFMLKMVQLPSSPLKQIVVISLFGMPSAVFESVDMLVFMSITVLMLGWLSRFLFEGIDDVPVIITSGVVESVNLGFLDKNEVK